jgi:hypothetical protein
MIIDYTENDIKNLVPSGTYLCRITNIGKYTSKAGKNSLRVTVSIIDDPNYAGRILNTYLNVYSHSSDIRVLALRQYHSLCVAAIHRKANDTDELVGRNVMCGVEISDASNGYMESNRIAYFLPAPTSNTVPF